MIIKSNKSNILIYGVLLSLFALFLVSNKQTLIVVSHDAYENYMSTNPGFSSARNLVDTGGDNKYQSIFYKLKSMIGKSPESILYIFRNNQNEELKNIDILIKFPNYKKILNDRANAIKKNYLEGPVFVDAKVNFDGRDYKAKVRLKGDLGDHWFGSSRMSLRVNLKNSNTILGFNKFSLHKPRARQYPYDQAFQESLREMGNITANHAYAKVTFNGEDWGIMNVEEHFSKEFLEKQRVKDSLIFRFSDDKKWLQFNLVNFPNGAIGFKDDYPNYRYSDPKLISTVTQQAKYLHNKTNRKRYTYVLEQRLKEEHASLYSVEPHMRAFFATLLWNNKHTLGDNNSRYYFNPYTLQLEPITTDEEMFSLRTEKLNTTLNEMFLTETYKQVLTSFRNNNDKNKYLIKAAESLVNIEEKLNQFNSYFPLDAYKKDEVLIKNINLITKDEAVLYEWLNNFDLNKQSDITINNTSSTAQGKYFPEHLHVRHYDDGKLLIFNLLLDEVKINRIVFDGKVTDYADLIIPGYTSNNYEPFILQTNITGIQDDKIIVYSSYVDNERSIGAYPTFMSDGLSNPLIGGTTKNTPFLINKGSNLWEILPGKWVIKQPILVDGNLRIKEGTHLKLSKDSYLIVKGRIEFIGSKTTPIIFESLDSGWKGLYVLSDEDSKSILHNVIFKDTTGLSDGLLELSGGVNIYKGSVDVRNVTIDDSSAEDALNIVKASISVDGLNIQNATSDAFDCDYCIGTINESYFNQIGGDALDFSGSEVAIESIEINHVRDKGLSIGEASTVDIKRSNFANVGVGIATKDASKASAENVAISNYTLYAAMTYSKKKYYDVFSSLNLNNCIIDGSDPYLRQSKTLLIVNGVEVPESEVNVEDLYSSGVMNNER